MNNSWKSLSENEVQQICGISYENLKTELQHGNHDEYAFDKKYNIFKFALKIS